MKLVSYSAQLLSRIVAISWCGLLLQTE